ncbi:unnamed protein product, partial [Polarella glacialis]
MARAGPAGASSLALARLRSSSAPARQISGCRLPRICVALLVRGVSPGIVESFIRYHLAIGFQRVTLFFDAPDEPGEMEVAEAAVSCAAFARRAGLGEVVVNLCTADWWKAELPQSRFVQRRGSAQDRIYNDLMELYEDIHDVQARQCLAMEHALRKAVQDGFDWLLHIDS